MKSYPTIMSQSILGLVEATVQGGFPCRGLGGSAHDGSRTAAQWPLPSLPPTMYWPFATFSLTGFPTVGQTLWWK